MRWQSIVETNTVWSRAGISEAPRVDIGCPSLPLSVAAPPFEGYKPRGNIVAQAITEPSEYSVFVFVAPVERIEELLGGSRYRVVPQEYMFWDDQGVLTAQALYLTPKEIETDAEFVKIGLEGGLGLRDIREPTDETIP